MKKIGHVVWAALVIFLARYVASWAMAFLSPITDFSVMDPTFVVWLLFVVLMIVISYFVIHRLIDVVGRSLAIVIVTIVLAVILDKWMLWTELLRGEWGGYATWMALSWGGWIGPAAMILGAVLAWYDFARKILRRRLLYILGGVAVIAAAVFVYPIAFSALGYKNIPISYGPEGLCAIGLLDQSECDEYLSDPESHYPLARVKRIKSSDVLTYEMGVVFNSGHERVVLGLPGDKVYTTQAGRKLVIERSSGDERVYTFSKSIGQLEIETANVYPSMNFTVPADRYFMIPLQSYLSPTEIRPTILPWHEMKMECDLEERGRVDYIFYTARISGI